MKLLTVLFLLAASNAFGQQTAPVVRTDAVVMSDGFNVRGAMVQPDTFFYAAYSEVKPYKRTMRIWLEGWIDKPDSASVFLASLHIVKLRWRGYSVECHCPTIIKAKSKIISILESKRYGLAILVHTNEPPPNW